LPVLLELEGEPASKASPASDLKKQLKTRSAISDAILGKEKQVAAHDQIRTVATAAAADPERIGYSSSEKGASGWLLGKRG